MIAPIAQYLEPFRTDPFLSANEEDVQQATNYNIAAGLTCTNMGTPINSNDNIKQIRIAFDGECFVIFR